MEYVSIDDVYSAYYSCRKHKRNTQGAMAYELDYERNNYKLYTDLNNMTYEVGRSIAFCVTRPKLREVFAADFRDRVVHHLIMQRFMTIFEAHMIESSYNCRKGKGTLYGVRDIYGKIKAISENWTQETYALKFDIQGFFMSIDKKLLYGKVVDVVKTSATENKDWWLWLIRKVIMHRPQDNCEIRGDSTLWGKLPKHKTLFGKEDDKGMAIGNLTSQVFANLFLSDFDRWVCSQLGKNEGYGRLTDDCVVISRNKTKLLRLLSDARKRLTDIGLTLHPHKVYLQEVTKGLPFVGSVIKPSRIYTQHRTIDNMRAMIRAWNVDKRPNTARYVCRYNSYSGFLVHTQSYGIRCRMWELVENKNNIKNINFKYIKHDVRKSTNQKGRLSGYSHKRRKTHRTYQSNRNRRSDRVH